MCRCEPEVSLADSFSHSQVISLDCTQNVVYCIASKVEGSDETTDTFVNMCSSVPNFACLFVQ